MNKTLSNALVFVAGAAIGSLVTWKLTKTKYERIAQEEIDSVKEVFSKRAHQEEEHDEPREERIEKAEDNEKKEYIKRLNSLGYVEYEEEGEAEASDDLDIISPEEFGSINYETVYLSYYADHILADEFDDPVEDVEGTVGSYALTRFGEYEDEVIHVRNHKSMTDYEVTIDSRSFSEDIVGVSPAHE